MAKFSKELINKLTEFLICEVDSKALSGITYAMALKDDKGREMFKRYKKILKEIKNCGYESEEIFRIYDVGNGYIFDMDLSVTKRITIELTKAVAKANNDDRLAEDIIGDKPDIRRKEDMTRLSRHIQKEYFEKGNSEIEVALFSRNSVPRIIITGKDKEGHPTIVRYNSYAVRHWDIEAINRKILIPKGVRVGRIQPREVLPSLTGCSFMLFVEQI